jgi:hypothetical protein
LVGANPRVRPLSLKYKNIKGKHRGLPLQQSPAARETYKTPDQSLTFGRGEPADLRVRPVRILALIQLVYIIHLL